MQPKLGSSPQCVWLHQIARKSDALYSCHQTKQHTQPSKTHQTLQITPKLLYSLPKFLLCHTDIVDNGNAAETRRTQTQHFTGYLQIWRNSLASVVAPATDCARFKRVTENSQGTKTSGQYIHIHMMICDINVCTYILLTEMAIHLRSINNYSRISGAEIIQCTEILHNKRRPTK